jgi:hypothetical protein
MKILMVTPELDPFVKVGGLGDMVGALAKQLTRMGHDVRCIVPLYGSVKRLGTWEARAQPLGADLAGGPEFARVWETGIPGSEAKVYFIEHERFFGRPEVYSNAAGSFPDNDKRFIFLGRARPSTSASSSAGLGCDPLPRLDCGLSPSGSTPPTATVPSAAAPPSSPSIIWSTRATATNTPSPTPSSPSGSSPPTTPRPAAP